MQFETFKKYNFDPHQPQKKNPVESIQSLPKETALELYRLMLRLRRCEEALIKEYHPADEMKCPVHFCVGQEAVPAALTLLLQQKDYLFSHHRSHGYFLSKNAPMKALFAEIYGRQTGANSGNAGSQDISMSEVNFFSGAILAGSVPLAAGAAYTFKYKKIPQIAVSGFGDAATEEGVFWETLNYASLKKLPLLLICENNYYSTFAPQNKRSATLNIAERVHQFGLRSRTVYGNDITNTYKTLKEAADYVRSGEGPAFVEAFTYRWNGHVGPENDDVNGYRPAAELAFWKEQCPVTETETQLLSCGYLTASENDQIKSKIDAEIQECFEFAKSSPFPNVTDLATLNQSARSPLADRYLRDEKNLGFNEQQAELIPGPY